LNAIDINKRAQSRVRRHQGCRVGTDEIRSWRTGICATDMVSTLSQIKNKIWSTIMFYTRKKQRSFSLTKLKFRTARVRFICLQRACTDSHHDLINGPCRGAVYKPAVRSGDTRACKPRPYRDHSHRCKQMKRTRTAMAP